MFARRYLPARHRVARLRGQWVDGDVFETRARTDPDHQYDGFQIRGRYLVDPGLWHGTAPPGDWYRLNHRQLDPNVQARPGRPDLHPDEIQDEVVLQTRRPVHPDEELRYRYTGHTPQGWAD
jgi:hypothetical protein